MSKAAAQAKKTEGNNFFKVKNYEDAITKYSEAINLDPSDVTFYSNRSACYAALNRWQEAADDGNQCIVTDRAFVKGYFRHALALQHLNDLPGALNSVKRGLGVEPSNADLKRMSREIEESQRVRRVESAISQAETQIAENDINGAFKTIESAQRLDPDNDTLTRLAARVKPLYERAEKQRVASLDSKERIKEEGDTFFKNADFEKAIKSYTRCLDQIPDKSVELALKCYANRAACYKQLSNFDGTIEDCTAVLEFKPDDVKALVRRAQAYEACERYRSALQDVRQVLAYGQESVGKSSYDLCNGMQHRLNRVIAQLRA
jgi:stress-induced-phosphoprotein 1